MINWYFLPNAITIARLMMAPLVLWCIVQGKFYAALILMIICGFSDAVDGWLARHYHWQSRLGGLLDPAADKIMMLSGYIGLLWVEQAGFWLVFAIVLRDIVIILGALAYHFLIKPLHAHPSYVSKLTTVLQVCLLCILLFHANMPSSISAQWINMLTYVTIVVTAMSGMHYVWIWAQKARQDKSIN